MNLSLILIPFFQARHTRLTTVLVSDTGPHRKQDQGADGRTLRTVESSSSRSASSRTDVSSESFRGIRPTVP